MEPVPVTHTVRRTVRMAVVLVVGQALLCALIGWMVFGRPGAAGRPPGAPLAEPPHVIPAPPGVTPRTPADTGSAQSSPAPGRSARPASLPVVEPFVGTLQFPAPPSATVPAPAPSAPARWSGEPTPNPSGTVAPAPLTEPVPTPTPTPAPVVPNGQEQDGSGIPVRVDGPCRTPEAYATTPDGVLVQCLPDGHGTTRWKIVEGR